MLFIVLDDTGFGQSGLDATGWELYHVAEDFAENHNVAADHRDRLIAMIGTWYVEAGRYGVMPVNGSGLARMIAEKPLVAVPRDSYTYLPGTQSIPFFAGPGRLQLYVDGALAGNAEAPVTTPFVLNPGALTCGANPGSPVTDDYRSPFKFTGTIDRVTVDVSGELIHDSEAELRVHMARQ